MTPTKQPPNLDLLVRRDRRPIVFKEKSATKENFWSDLRAWMVSCVFHTAILVVFALIWRQQTHGTSGLSDRAVGVAVSQQSDDGNEYELEGGSSGSINAGSTIAQEVPMAMENGEGPPISVDSIVDGLIGTKSGPENGGAPGSGLAGNGGFGSGTGKGNGKGSGQKGRTSFFGIQGSGRSFVYVVDRSDSMNNYGSAPLRKAKQEVIKSLESLSEFNQFQIVFYNDSLAPMTSSLLFAEDSNKRRAKDFVRNMPGDGSTAHMPALKQGLAMSPEVIFFLTDADDPMLTMQQLLEIQRRAELTGTTIHTIQFNVGPASNDGSWIRVLAEMNRGNYKYVDVSTIENLPGN